MSDVFLSEPLLYFSCQILPKNYVAKERDLKTWLLVEEIVIWWYTFCTWFTYYLVLEQQKISSLAILSRLGHFLLLTFFYLHGIFCLHYLAMMALPVLIKIYSWVVFLSVLAHSSSCYGVIVYFEICMTFDDVISDFHISPKISSSQRVTFCQNLLNMILTEMILADSTINIKTKFCDGSLPRYRNLGTQLWWYKHLQVSWF